MKLIRLVLLNAAIAALIVAPTLAAAQADQAAEATKKAEKHAKEKVKKTEQSAGEATGTAGAKASETAKATKTKNPTVSESEIAAAKTSGKVWVNTETGVYHKGGQWYGATKQGKFMTENEAVKAGYRASKGK
jgi:hypothetical protein